jgi:hypothetical protein
MSEETVRAAELAIELREQHRRLLYKFESGSQHEAIYDYQRWVERSERLLKQYVSVEEANRFAGIAHQSYNVFRHGEDAELYLFYEEVQAFLLGLMRGVISNMVEINPAALQSKRNLVLYKLYELAPDDKIGDVIVDDLATTLGMQYNEVNNILEYWQRKGMVRDGSFDAAIRLEPYAIDEIEESLKTKKSTRHIPYTTINYIDNRVTIHGDNLGQAQAGNNATQSMTNNQSISEILPKLTAFIEAVRQADFPDKDDAVHDLEKAHELAGLKQTEGTWQRIQTKLNAAKTTMEIAGFVYNTHPYWPAIWNFFHLPKP